MSGNGGDISRSTCVVERQPGGAPERPIFDLARAIARGLARADYENQDGRGMLESACEH